MIKLLMDYIKENKESVQNYIRDNYELRRGLYMKVSIDKPFSLENNCEYLIVKDKMNHWTEYLYQSNNENIYELYKYVSDRDKYSKILNDDSNKTIDVPYKKALSSVYLSYCINNKFSYYNELSKEKQKFSCLQELLEHNSNKIFGYFKDIESHIKNNLNLNKYKYENNEFNKFLNAAKNKTRTENINIVEEYLNENINKILSISNDIVPQNNNIIKIFFYSDMSKIDDTVINYEKEYMYYLMNNIFNKGSIKIVNDEIYGMITYGYNYSQKKYGLQPQCMNIPCVNYVSLKDAMNIKLCYEYLQIISKKSNYEFCKINNGIHEDFNNLFIKLDYKEKFISDYKLNASKVTYKNSIGDLRLELNNYIGRDSSIVNLKNINMRNLFIYILGINKKSFIFHSEYTLDHRLIRLHGSAAYECEMALLYKQNVHIIHGFLNNNIKNLRDEEYLRIFNIIDKAILIYFKNMYANNSYIYEIGRLLNIKFNICIKLNESINAKSKINLYLPSINLCNGNICINSDEDFYYILGQLAFYIESRRRGDIDTRGIKTYTDKQCKKDLLQYLEIRKRFYLYNIDNEKCENIQFRLEEYEPEKNIKECIQYFYLGIVIKNHIN